MKDPIFTPEDFEDADPQDTLLGSKQRECAAYLATRKLNSLLGPEVFGHQMASSSEWIYGTKLNPPDAERADTHRARLFDVQEIVKEKCVEHVPKLQSRQPVGLPDCDDRYGAALILGCSIVCAKCGVRLKAEWKEIEGE